MANTKSLVQRRLRRLPRRAFVAALLTLIACMALGASAGSARGNAEVNLGATDTAASASALASAWYDDDWQYRRAVQISHPGGGDPVSEYQVQIELDGSFDFAHALANGSDLRVTSEDGTSLIPFWIEDWNPGGEEASIWVKVPSIPLAGTTFNLYYGNASPPAPSAATPVPVPPTGPYTKAAKNPQPIANAPCGGSTPQSFGEHG